DEVRVFTRRLNDVTIAVPEVVERVRSLAARSLVLDGETIVLGEDGRPRPFQVTMTRFGRRLDVDQMRRSLPLTSFFFDLLHLDGVDLIDRPASERQAALSRVAGEPAIPRVVTSDPDEAERFLTQSLDAGHEGIMAKDPASPYEA